MPSLPPGRAGTGRPLSAGQLCYTVSQEKPPAVCVSHQSARSEKHANDFLGAPTYLEKIVRRRGVGQELRPGELRYVVKFVEDIAEHRLYFRDLEHGNHLFRECGESGSFLLGHESFNKPFLVIRRLLDEGGKQFGEVFLEHFLVGDIGRYAIEF
ncbi:leucine-rich PPR motif-containing mitochondrial protein, putative [Babesia ovata]|uniref:Leucine-rich PPR motif-containing mitochondrial protein, putative n=1 Tax=Babesia ovata TaxID=189622 RepID=A0A2H6KBU3_9APIC|nr:leucine-rich PPR motif-containing mitochondrial protein, putative [Babesia ovata]GBE60461.1 leucine-rich PPR motif-containing mitochondrial protein, putative [Babesia ovata]